METNKNNEISYLDYKFFTFHTSYAMPPNKSVEKNYYKNLDCGTT